MSAFALCVDSTQASKLHAKGEREVAATYHGRATCPKACPLYDEGCFAWSSLRTRHAGETRRESSGRTWGETLAWLRAKPAGALVRLAISGEALPKVPGDSDRIDPVALRELASACAHLVCWTYTHAPCRPEDGEAWASNVCAIAEVNAATMARGMGLAINASANSPEHALALQRFLTGLPVPVATVCADAEDARRAGFACPAAVKDGRTCATCVGPTGVPLCARPGRGHTVGFPVHGTAHKRALRVVQGAS